MYMAPWELDASGPDLVVDEARQAWAFVCHNDSGWPVFELSARVSDTYTGVRLEG